MDNNISKKQKLARLPKDKRQAFLDSLTDEQALALLNSWEFKARPSQLPPDGDWFVWLMMMGRGGGKSYAASNYIIDRVISGDAKRIALVGRTTSDTLDVMVNGKSGILAVAEERGIVAKHEPSKRTISFPQYRAKATTYSAEEGDSLRGPEFDTAWADEAGAWSKHKDQNKDAWSNLVLATRLRNPRIVVSTTPRSTKLIKELLKSPSTVVTRGTTYDNADNLSPEFIKQVSEKYGGTRLGKQELFGELLDDNENALWTSEILDDTRVRDHLHLDRIVVAIDPAVSTTASSDFTAITVSGTTLVDGTPHFYVLLSEALKVSPNQWATHAIELYEHYQADKIVAEKNNGGDMVESTILNVDPNAPVKLIHATRGKQLRAEPVAALFEQNRAHLVGEFTELEEQLCQFPDVEHDDLVDSMVYSITELMESKKKNNKLHIFRYT